MSQMVGDIDVVAINNPITYFKIIDKDNVIEAINFASKIGLIGSIVILVRVLEFRNNSNDIELIDLIDKSINEGTFSHPNLIPIIERFKINPEKVTTEA